MGILERALAILPRSTGVPPVFTADTGETPVLRESHALVFNRGEDYTALPSPAGHWPRAMVVGGSILGASGKRKATA